MSWIKINNINNIAEVNKNINLQKLEIFIKENNIVTYKSTSSVFAKSMFNFFKSGGEYGRNLIQINMPHLDHCIIFKTKSGDVILTSHSYVPIESMKDNIDKWANENNLKAKYYDSTYSWYNSTNLVVIRLKSLK